MAIQPVLAPDRRTTTGTIALNPDTRRDENNADGGGEMIGTSVEARAAICEGEDIGNGASQPNNDSVTQHAEVGSGVEVEAGSGVNAAARRPANNPRRQRRCRICKGLGHDVRTCPEKAAKTQ